MLVTSAPLPSIQRALVAECHGDSRERPDNVEYLADAGAASLDEYAWNATLHISLRPQLCYDSHGHNQSLLGRSQVVLETQLE